jgi:hypothetical protein
MPAGIDHEHLDALVQDLMQAIAKPLDRPPNAANVILVLSGLAFVTAAVLGGTNDQAMVDFYHKILRGCLPERSPQALFH